MPAQVIEVVGGASTAYDAQGGSVTVHSERGESSFGAGMVGGHLQAGGASTRLVGHGSVTAGQQQLALDLPTDLFSTGHRLSGLGLGVRQHADHGTALTAFAGLSSQEGGSALFRTASTGARTGYTQLRHHVSSGCTVSSLLLLSQTHTALGSLECRVRRPVTLAVSGGMGAGSPYLAIAGSYEGRRLHLRAALAEASSQFTRGTSDPQPVPEPIRENVGASFRLSRSTSLSALHQNFLTPGTPGSGTPPARSGVDQLAWAFQRRATGVSLSLLHSTFAASPSAGQPAQANSALSAAFEHGFGLVRWTETLLATRPSSERSFSATLLSGLSVPFGAHLRLSEQVAESGGHLSLSHGGDLVTSFSSFHLDHQLLYLPTQPAHPFQQAVVLSAEMRLLQRLSLQAQSSLDATGKTHYTVSLGTVLSRQANAPALEPGAGRSSMGAHMLRGIVVDTEGIPVGGAALLIGAERIYSDSAGTFLVRSSHAESRTFRLLPDEFLTPGSFVGVNAPGTVRLSQVPAAPLRIVVARRALATAVAELDRAAMPGTFAAGEATR